MATMVAWNMGAQHTWADENNPNPSEGSSDYKWWQKCDLPPQTPGQTGMHYWGLDANGNYDSDPVGWKQLTGPGDDEPRWYLCFIQERIVSNPVTEQSYGANEHTCEFECQGRFSMVPCGYEGQPVDAPADTSGPSQDGGFGEWTAWEGIKRIGVQGCDEDSGDMTSAPSSEDPEVVDDVMDSGVRIKTNLITSDTPDSNAVVASVEVVHPHTNRSGGVLVATTVFSKSKTKPASSSQ